MSAGLSQRAMQRPLDARGGMRGHCIRSLIWLGRRVPHAEAVSALRALEVTTAYRGRGCDSVRQCLVVSTLWHSLVWQRPMTKGVMSGVAKCT